ncbi:MAG: S-methyl-5-thioribose-1-phosphate isomerase [Spirochaetales bacterium]|nr:MAG: S-methyl-5-thioribose-1-phosphate isomerase [Spirochaetales bacterium]
MNIDGNHYRTIWVHEDDPSCIRIIDQRKLPFELSLVDLRTAEETALAIKDMWVRGAGLIGAAAGYGMYLASLEAPDGPGFYPYMEKAADRLIKTRPTAKNLEWAVLRQLASMRNTAETDSRRRIAFATAAEIADEDADYCRRIGEHGLTLIRAIAAGKKGKPVEILTHCNAGWLAFVDYGSATSPVYAAFDEGIPVHVWVDETRPRNQGASLTAWELGKHGVPHHLIVDNAGGHLMQHGMVDMVITGADRVTAGGDAANKIGTYLKALAAKDNGVPFYVALPSSTFDWDIVDGVRDIPIEERDQDEVRYIRGLGSQGTASVLLCPETTEAKNYGFDVTPGRLITGLITERGICGADRKSLAALFPDKIKG